MKFNQVNQWTENWLDFKIKETKSLKLNFQLIPPTHTHLFNIGDGET